jgi:hypothetical protein
MIGVLWHYKQRGLYYAQLRRYFDRFDANQIKVYFYEDFKANSMRLLQDIFRFLGVDETFVPDMSVRYNVSGIPKSKRLYALVSRRNSLFKIVLRPFLPARLRKRWMANLRGRYLVRSSLPADVRRELVQEYRGDILKLEGLVQRDLSMWLEQPG